MIRESDNLPSKIATVDNLIEHPAEFILFELAAPMLTRAKTKSQECEHDLSFLGEAQNRGPDHEIKRGAGR
jgi:hypothetical protein